MLLFACEWLFRFSDSPPRQCITCCRGELILLEINDISLLVFQLLANAFDLLSNHHGVCLVECVVVWWLILSQNYDGQFDFRPSKMLWFQSSSD